MGKTCVFCGIAGGEIESDILYKDNWSFAVKDLYPRAPIHILVIPIKHIESLKHVNDTVTGILGHLLNVCEKIATEQNLSESGYRVSINQGKDSGQTFSHLHLHLMGGRKLGPEG